MKIINCKVKQDNFDCITQLRHTAKDTRQKHMEKIKHTNNTLWLKTINCKSTLIKFSEQNSGTHVACSTSTQRTQRPEAASPFFWTVETLIRPDAPILHPGVKTFFFVLLYKKLMFYKLWWHWISSKHKKENSCMLDSLVL